MFYAKTFDRKLRKNKKKTSLQVNAYKLQIKDQHEEIFEFLHSHCLHIPLRG